MASEFYRKNGHFFDVGKFPFKNGKNCFGSSVIFAQDDTLSLKDEVVAHFAKFKGKVIGKLDQFRATKDKNGALEFFDQSHVHLKHFINDTRFDTVDEIERLREFVGVALREMVEQDDAWEDP